MTQELMEFESDPYSLFVFAINSPLTKAKYVARLNKFLDFIKLTGTIQEKCTTFAEKSKSQPSWVLGCVIKFLQMNKERVERNDIAAATALNYVKTIKLFCEMNDIMLPWKRITKGLPKGRRYADDRAPTIEEIHKIIEYPDRRIRPIVFTMVSSGIRLGAWDYLKWKNVIPIEKEGKVIAAKLIVYQGEPEEYFTFMTPEAYLELEKWMSYRKDCGENITKESWVLRNIWDRNRSRKNKLTVVTLPRKLHNLGVKRIMETALWTQGLRHKLELGKKRHEFQTDHGLRKLFKTRCELSGMKSINIEILMGHSVGISDSYYRATEKELLEDYLKAVDYLTISNEYKLQKDITNIIDQSDKNYTQLKFENLNKEAEITVLKEKELSNSDAIAGLSERVMDLTKEIELLKRKGIKT
jgi:integrase